MARIVALLRKPVTDRTAPSAVPTPGDFADELASAVSGMAGEGWNVDVAVSAETSQVTIFGRTNDGARDFIIPIHVGQPVVLNAAGTAAHDNFVPEP